MYYTICHKTNHNVETCKVKRKGNHVHVVFEVITQYIKVHGPMMYLYHICGDTRHKIIDCL
jgi:REP element-mobilizing transposase RayT